MLHYFAMIDISHFDYNGLLIFIIAGFLILYKLTGNSISHFSNKFKVIAFLIILILFAWINFPDPRSIEIEPLTNDFSTVPQEEKYEANMANINLEFSSLTEMISALGYESEVSKLIEEMQEAAEASNNLKYKNINITVPENSGIINEDGKVIYNWRKTYNRFFSSQRLYDDNIFILFGNRAIYVSGGQNGYFSAYCNITYGTLRE